MKFILFVISTLLILPLQAQVQPDNQDTLNRTKKLLFLSIEKSNSSDTTWQTHPGDSPDNRKTTSLSELFQVGKNTCKKGTPAGKYAPFEGHWSGFYYGFVNFAHLPEKYKELDLDWSHSFAMQFNICTFDQNFSARNNFGLVTGLGLEYQRLRFNQDNISLTKKDGQLEIIHPQDLYDDMASIKRSTFKVLYLTIPVMLEVQFPAAHSKRFYLSGGVMGGVRMHSKTKIVYDNPQGDKEKQKHKGNFNMVPFKADAVARIGYRNVSIWGSYTLTNMFKSDGPHLHPYTIGLGLNI